MEFSFFLFPVVLLFSKMSSLNRIPRISQKQYGRTLQKKALITRFIRFCLNALQLKICFHLIHCEYSEKEKKSMEKDKKR